MLKKLLYYEWLSVRRYLLPLLGLTPFLALFAGMIGYFSARVTNLIVSIGLMTMYTFSMIALVLSFALLPVLLVVRYWSGLYSDNGYLTLMLPIRRRSLLFSKMLNSLLSMTVYLIVAALSLSFAVGAPIASGMEQGPLYAYRIAWEWVRGLSEAVPGPIPVLAVEGVLYLLAGLTLQFSILYLGVTLGAVIFQGKARIGGAVLFCFVTNSITSSLLTTVEFALSGGIVGIFSFSALTGAASTQLFLITEIVLRGGIAVGFFFLNSFLVTRKLNLS